MRFKCGNWQDNCRNMCDDFYCDECLTKDRERVASYRKANSLPEFVLPDVSGGKNAD